MYKYILLFICLMSAGCSHNALVYHNGTYTNIGFSPKNYDLGVQYFSGESVSVGTRENSSVEITYKKDNNTLDFKNAKSETAGIDKIKYTIGPQITGYLVDLAKENPELATKYITEQLKNNTKYYKILNNKLVEVSKEDYDKEEK